VPAPAISPSYALPLCPEEFASSSPRLRWVSASRGFFRQASRATILSGIAVITPVACLKNETSLARRAAGHHAWVMNPSERPTALASGRHGKSPSWNRSLQPCVAPRFSPVDLRV
jgi:hypothetical protein